LLSGGHVVVFRPWWHRNPPMTLIQAFVAPDSLAHLSSVDIGELCLTHEVLAEGCYTPTHLLRGPIVDPATRETNIRFLSADAHHEQSHYLCVDITIPPIDSTPMEVLPMAVKAQVLLVLSGLHRTVFLGASDDGHGRGIIILSTSEPSEPTDDFLLLYKLSIDASGEQHTAVVSEPRRLPAQEMPRFSPRCVFDGVRGRICPDPVAYSNYYDLVALGLK